MWFDIAEDRDLRDCLVIFTWDWDFLYPIKKLLDQWKQVIVISTKWHTAKELIDYISSVDDDRCRYVDIHKVNEITSPIRGVLKDDSRWVCLPPELYQWVQRADNSSLEELRDWVEAAIESRIKDLQLPDILATRQKSNKRNLRLTLLRWNEEEKLWLLEYLNEIIV